MPRSTWPTNMIIGVEFLRGDMNAVGAVHGARAAGDEADAGTAGQFAIGLGHDRRTAFLAADQHVDRRIMQCIKDGKKTLAGHASQPLHTLDLKLIDKNAAAAAGIALSSHVFTPLRRRPVSRNMFYLL